MYAVLIFTAYTAKMMNFYIWKLWFVLRKQWIILGSWQWHYHELRSTVFHVADMGEVVMQFPPRTCYVDWVPSTVRNHVPNEVHGFKVSLALMWALGSNEINEQVISFPLDLIWYSVFGNIISKAWIFKATHLLFYNTKIWQVICSYDVIWHVKTEGVRAR